MKTPHTGGVRVALNWKPVLEIGGGVLNRPYRRDLGELISIAGAEKGFRKLTRFLLGC